MKIYPKDEREVDQSPKTQGSWERRAYTFDFSDDDITTIEQQSVVVYLEAPGGARGDDVSSSVLSGDVSVDEDLILTTPFLHSLEAGKIYLLYGRVIHDNGQKSEQFCRMIARD